MRWMCKVLGVGAVVAGCWGVLHGAGGAAVTATGAAASVPATGTRGATTGAGTTRTGSDLRGDAEKARQALMVMVKASDEAILKGGLQSLASDPLEAQNFATANWDYLVGGYKLNLHDRTWRWAHNLGAQFVTFGGRFDILDDGTWKATLEEKGGT